MQFSDLVTDVLCGEILPYLKPYALNQVSLTSKHFRQNALTEALWEKHLTRDFPYSLEKGTAFEKYSKCKWKLLSKISNDLYRKCALLIEAGHLNELREIFPSYANAYTDFLCLVTLGNKHMPRIMNEQDDQAMIDFFYSNACEAKPLNQDYFAAAFGKINDLQRFPVDYFLFLPAVKCSCIVSLDYMVQQKPDLSGNTHLAVTNRSMEIVKWFSDHGAQFDDEDFTDAVWQGNKEFVGFFLEKMKPPITLIKKAIERAVSNGQPAPLEVLLPHFSQDKADLNYLLEYLDYYKSPNETAACLKMLLDRGAEIEHTNNVSGLTSLFRALCYPNNEMSIEILLNKGANPNLTFPGDSTPLIKAVNNYDLPIIKMLINHGAIVTEEIIAQAQLIEYKDISEIITLLKSHAIS